MDIMHIQSKESFAAEVLRAEGLVLVDFWAEWCGPCQMMGPVLEDFAQKYPQVKVVKVNVDELPDPAVDFGISSIPSLLLFEDGKLKQKTVGAMPLGELVQRLGL